MAEEQDRPQGRGGIGEGIRTGIGILSAFRDAIEETIQEAVNRGDLSPDRARDAVRSAAARVQEGLGDARERLDFVARRDFDDLRIELATLRAEVAELRGRLEMHEGKPEHEESGRLAPGGPPADASVDEMYELAAEAGTLADTPAPATPGGADDPGGEATGPSGVLDDLQGGTGGSPDAGGERRERTGGFPVDEAF